jgi:hypothetical protein
MEGLKSLLGRRGLETGGLLLGRTKQQHGRILVEIDDFAQIDCEHAFGTSYLLSPTDRQLLEERIAWHRSPSRPSIVGFYRSHTRKEFATTVEDVDLMSNYFAEPFHLFLLIQSNSEGPLTAGFVIWEGRKIRPTTPYMAFPFETSALISNGHAIGGGEPAAGQAGRAVTNVGLGRRIRIRIRISFPRFLGRLGNASLFRWGAFAGAALLLSIPAALWNQGAKPAVDSASLGLSLARDGNSFHLNWDRNASAIRAGSRGVLWILDGEVQEKVGLDAKHLKMGSLAYLPKSREVRFRLDVFARSSMMSESLVAVVLPESRQVPPPMIVETPAVAAVPAPPPRKSRRRRLPRQQSPPRLPLHGRSMVNE